MKKAINSLLIFMVIYMVVSLPGIQGEYAQPENYGEKLNSESLDEHEELAVIEDLDNVEELSVAEELSVKEDFLVSEEKEPPIQLRELNFEEGEFFVAKIMEDSDIETYEYKIPLEGERGIITWFNDEKVISDDLIEGELPKGTMLIIETEKMNYLFSQGYSYEDMGDGTRRSIDSVFIPAKVKLIGDVWTLVYTFELKESLNHIVWGIKSDQVLVDLEDDYLKELWVGYDVDESARFLEDGYYYKSPDNYTPSDENSYWRSPSMYVVTHFVEEGRSLGDDLLAKGWLTVAMDNMNSDGYFVSLPRSNWLYDDYGIDKGFFDTRFNADMAVTYLKAYEKYGIEAFKEISLDLCDYYVNHMVNYHYTFNRGLVNEGWLVYDYSQEGIEVPIHTALNHQLQGIHMLMLIYLEENNPGYMEVANVMLNGIKATRDLWIKDDGNLEYAYLPDGSMGYSDYKYLTYYDLLNVQSLMIIINGEGDSDLQKLIDAKAGYLTENP